MRPSSINLCRPIREYIDLGSVLPSMIINCIFQLTTGAVTPICKELIPPICPKNISVKLQWVYSSRGIVKFLLYVSGSSYSYPSVFNSCVHLKHVLTDTCNQN